MSHQDTYTQVFTCDSHVTSRKERQLRSFSLLHTELSSLYFTYSQFISQKRRVYSADEFCVCAPSRVCVCVCTHNSFYIHECTCVCACALVYVRGVGVVLFHTFLTAPNASIPNTYRHPQKMCTDRVTCNLIHSK